ncbi:MAG: class I SAM-dependent methyltransferase, partial [Alistipes sp.]|nr:class I SAM-dependent methyltransferase [Alistipes sp.]
MLQQSKNIAVIARQCAIRGGETQCPLTFIGKHIAINLAIDSSRCWHKTISGLKARCSLCTLCRHIRYAKEKTHKLGLDCAFVCGDALHAPFDDGTFDLVYSYTVAEHLPPEAFLREQRRVLKDG